MAKQLLIVFAKNLIKGRVKTRLAKEVGENKAFEVYRQLLKITENVVDSTEVQSVIYFSEFKDETFFLGSEKEIQEGVDLGEKMKNAFNKGFEKGFEEIILIGSDLPDLENSIILDAFDELKTKDLVLGPAVDGGYYLIGMNKMNYAVFENKPWSTAELYQITTEQLNQHKLKFSETILLNDVDTYEDYINSSIYRKD